MNSQALPNPENPDPSSSLIHSGSRENDPPLAAPDGNHTLSRGSSGQFVETQRHIEFRASIRNRNFGEALALIVANMAELRIETFVEDENDSADAASISDYQGLPGKRMITSINLLDGDIKNIIGNRFVRDETYGSVCEYHREQIVSGMQIIRDNIDTLKHAIQSLRELADQP
jgi:hypothetical protein